MEIWHGSLLNVHGNPARRSGYVINPADVELSGRSFSMGHLLQDFVNDRASVILRHTVNESFDAGWVRARIPRVFGFTPAPSEVEKSLLHAGFVAVPDEVAIGYPFVCTDHYGRTGLMFSEEGPEESVKQSIAAAFWGLIAEDPEDLADFEERVYHPGAGVWLHYSCKSGHVYCEETDE